MHINIPYNFIWTDYVSLNKDLSHINSEFDAINHYKKNINRCLPYLKIENFNWKMYAKNNSNLSNLSNYDKALNHYMTKGNKQFLSYNIDKSLHVNKKLYSQIVKTPVPNLIFVSYCYNNFKDIVKTYKGNLITYSKNLNIKFILVNFNGYDSNKIDKYVYSELSQFLDINLIYYTSTRTHSDKHLVQFKNLISLLALKNCRQIDKSSTNKKINIKSCDSDKTFIFNLDVSHRLNGKEYKIVINSKDLDVISFYQYYLNIHTVTSTESDKNYYLKNIAFTPEVFCELNGYKENQKLPYLDEILFLLRAIQRKYNYKNFDIYPENSYKKFNSSKFTDNDKSVLNNVLKDNLVNEKINLSTYTFLDSDYRYSLNKIDNILPKIFVKNINLEHNSFDYNNSNKYIISLTSIPNRFISDKFLNLIDSLTDQTYKVKYIIINICKNYERNFKFSKINFNKRIEYLEKKYNNVIVNFSIDYGPITKILGLYHLDKKYNIASDDRIIIVDDDFIFNKEMVSLYNLGYSLYNCEGIGINERDNIHWNFNYKRCICLKNNYSIFYDNYQGMLFGWLSWSIKYCYIQKLYEFYHTMTRLNKDYSKHDDLIVTCFYRSQNLYFTGLNYIIHNLYSDEDEHALHKLNNSYFIRKNLENTAFKIFKIPFLRNIKNHHHPDIRNNLSNYNNLIYNIKDEKIRNLTLVENMKQIVKSNEKMPDYMLNFTYINSNIFILTITFFNKCFSDTIRFFINDMLVQITIKDILSNYSFKQSFVFYSQNELIPKKIRKLNFELVSTHENNSANLQQFYSRCSFLINLPNIKSRFFSNKIRRQYLSTNFPIGILNLYDKLIPGSYRADFFRYLYLYQNSGMYHDIKMILFDNKDIFDIIDQNEYMFVHDLQDTYSNNNYFYNAFIFTKSKYNKYLKSILIGDEKMPEKKNLRHLNIQNNYGIIQNIHTSNYNEDMLSITGPGLISKFIHEKFRLVNIIPEHYKNTIDKNDQWKYSAVYDSISENLLTINSYSGYYNDNYYKTKHYSKLYLSRKVFKESDFMYKINGINYINYINLDRSQDRNNHMKWWLSKVNIKFSRVSGIDGRESNIRKLVNDNNLSNHEIGCCLSHIKAISELKDKEGSYFAVLEDDVLFKNVMLMDDDIKSIINKAPKNFDILIMSKVYHYEINTLFSEWINYYNKNPLETPSGARFYIITKKAVHKFINTVACHNNNQFSFFKDIEVSDRFIYKYMNTYVYKYNYINDGITENKVKFKTTFSENDSNYNYHGTDKWHVITESIQNKIIYKNLLKNKI